MTRPKHEAALLALVLAFVMLFSVLYIALEADHDCCGDDCVICAQLQVCGNLLKTLLIAALLLPAARCLCAAVRASSDENGCFVRPLTLTVLKVKLSD